MLCYVMHCKTVIDLIFTSYSEKIAVKKKTVVNL